MRIFKPKMYCEPLRSNPQNRDLIKDFFIERESDCDRLFEERGEVVGLSNFLRHGAWTFDEENEIKVYLIKTYFSHEIVAYFALKAGMISVDDENRDYEKEKLAKAKGIKLVPNTVSGIEISHFAVNDAYRQKHGNVKALGEYIYPAFIYPVIKRTANLIGVKIVYLYAADQTEEKDKHKLVDYYRDVFHFSEGNRNDYVPVTSYYDNGCIFMYQTL